MNRYSFIFSLLAPLFLGLLSFEIDPIDASNQELKTEYVVILIIDGPRMSETFCDSTHQYIPNLANVLAPQGVLVKCFKNNGPTYTNAGHAAITTGNYQRIKNNGLVLPKNPSIFQYYLKEKGLDSTHAWVISSKGKLSILANTKHKKWKDQYTPARYCGIDGSGMGYSNDDPTFAAVKRIFGQYHPKLTLINLLEVDVRGHQRQWKEYLEGIQHTDQKALELWNWIQSDPIMKDKTTLLITNDHGRHLDGIKEGFAEHGDNCEGCRSIYLVALGPDFKKNAVLSRSYEQIDISATVAKLLKFDFPISDGEVMTELFLNSVE